MIARIQKVQNVGLLQNAVPNGAVDLGRVTLIYAENGRGKSTLASILQACAFGDIGRLNARRTLDITGLPEISLLIQNGSQYFQIDYQNSQWSGNLPSIVVFDSEFVERNVYAGLEIRPDQRQSLLSFAIGDEVVALKQQVEQLTAQIEDQTRSRSEAERALTVYAAPYSVNNFLSLVPVDDAQHQIETIQKRIDATRNVEQLAMRQEPVPLQFIQLDVDNVFKVLGKQLQDIEQSAEALVRDHFFKHTERGFEDWVNRGQTYLTLDECPFCGQSLKDLDLINAYRSYFNTAYNDMKKEVAKWDAQIGLDLADSKIEAIQAGFTTNIARIEAWKDQLEINTPTLPVDRLREGLSIVRGQVSALVSRKRLAPLELIGSDSERESVSNQLIGISQMITSYNTEVALLAQKISAYKKTLAAENIGLLQEQIKQLEVAKKRKSDEVIKTVQIYQEAENERNRLNGEKTQTREQIDVLMMAMLQRYQSEINNLLVLFGAEFSIEQLKPSYTGTGEPRTEYALKIRNKSIKLGSRADILTEHSFGSTLSDADKRTLAFAFFIARLKTDPNLSNKIVVLDDPISSLDRNRRRATLQIVRDTSQRCKQLIFLTHDAYSVRELSELLSTPNPTPIIPTILEITRTQNGYSIFSNCDIESICSSEYYRHHRIVSDFVEGKSTVNSRDVAKAIRPLLEGYYYRRFPKSIRKKTTFGNFIRRVGNSRPPDPLSNLLSLQAEMSAINEYTRQFHHDQNENDETIQVVETELLGFAQRALDLIYKNG